jgi:hypothetical protein
LKAPTLLCTRARRTWDGHQSRRPTDKGPGATGVVAAGQFDENGRDPREEVTPGGGAVRPHVFPEQPLLGSNEGHAPRSGGSQCISTIARTMQPVADRGERTGFVESPKDGRRCQVGPLRVPRNAGWILPPAIAPPPAPTARSGDSACPTNLLLMSPSELAASGSHHATLAGPQHASASGRPHPSSFVISPAGSRPSATRHATVRVRNQTRELRLLRRVAYRARPRGSGALASCSATSYGLPVPRGVTSPSSARDGPLRHVLDEGLTRAR